jgi:hypothetical protein
MALSDDLLEQANHLANREPKRPRQASLRRAVSTAYYSLFHLLVSSAISQWKSPQQRAQMARGFEHRAMKEASKKIPYKQVDPADVFVADHLKIVAKASSSFSNIVMPLTTAMSRNGHALRCNRTLIQQPMP